MTAPAHVRGAPFAFRVGCGVFGMQVMKFTLTYDGPLPSSGNKAKNQVKWDIRQHFHPQLADLWESHPALRQIHTDGRYFPKYGGAKLHQAHHLHAPPAVHWEPSEPGMVLDLCAPIEKHGSWFRPLIRDTFALHCGLKISFLRKEAPGKIYQGGDIDGRIKTLLDALTMPRHAEQVLHKVGNDEYPVHCLLEDDSLVSGLQVETERLLTDNNHASDYARLTIEVDVRVRQAMIYNQSFLG
jgi:hypothetical protein